MQNTETKKAEILEIGSFENNSKGGWTISGWSIDPKSQKAVGYSVENLKEVSQKKKELDLLCGKN